MFTHNLIGQLVWKAITFRARSQHIFGIAQFEINDQQATSDHRLTIPFYSSPLNDRTEPIVQAQIGGPRAYQQRFPLVTYTGFANLYK